MSITVLMYSKVQNEDDTHERLALYFVTSTDSFDSPRETLRANQRYFRRFGVAACDCAGYRELQLPDRTDTKQSNLFTTLCPRNTSLNASPPVNFFDLVCMNFDAAIRVEP